MRVDLPLPLEELARIARTAGVLIMDVYRSGAFDARAKADASPVTAADLAAHRCILSALSKATPLIPVISEEGADVTNNAAALLAREALVWMVDPLDGTRDFLARTDEFTVNIALIARGHTIAGCVYAPAKDEMYFASTGAGATMGESTKIRTRRATAAPHVLVSRQHHGGEASAAVVAFPGATTDSVGSSLKYCLIARGSADAAFRRTPTMLWDTAAAECILVEAGGRIVTGAGKPLSYAGPALENPPFVALGDANSALEPWLALVDPGK